VLRSAALAITVGVAASVLACSGAVSDEASTSEAAYGGNHVLRVAGWPLRPVVVHVPPAYAPAAPAPLLLVLHGGGHDAAKMVELTCPRGDVYDAGCLHRVAERAGFVTAYLNGTPNAHAPSIRTWNGGGGRDGFSCVSNLACERDVDDVAYVDAVLDMVEARMAIDPERVFATGISNGGAMAHRLACERSDRIAGIVAVAAGNQFSTTAPCVPTHPVSVLQIHGTDDAMWPFEGGPMPKNPGVGIGARASTDDWALRNGCRPTPAVSGLPDVAPLDGTRARLERHPACVGGADVSLLVIEGGGHTWPSGYQYQSESKVGRTSYDVDANLLLVEYLSAR